MYLCRQDPYPQVLRKRPLGWKGLTVVRVYYFIHIRVLVRWHGPCPKVTTTHKHICTHALIHTHPPSHTNIYTHTPHTHTYIHTYTHIYIHTHKHRHIHTYTPSTSISQPTQYASCYPYHLQVLLSIPSARSSSNDSIFLFSIVR